MMTKEDRALFEEQSGHAPAAIAPREDVEAWKAKLAVATNHAERNVALQKAIGRDIGDRVKHYRKLAAALAEAIRDKSPLPLEIAFRNEDIEELLEELKPRELYCDSLQVWREQERDRARAALEGGQ